MSTQGEGWYADPQDASRLRWWDGVQWTEHVHDGVAQWDRRPALGDGWPRIAVALQVALAATIAASVFVLVSNRTILDVWRRIDSDPTGVSQSEADTSDALSRWGLVEIPTLLVCGILFIVWLHRAHRSDRMDPSWFKRGSGWAIGAWFVPVVNLWFPFQVVSDLRRGARGEGHEPSHLLQWCWWVAFLVYWGASNGTNSLYRQAGEVPDSNIPEYVDRLETAIRVEAFAEGASIVAAVLAIAMVRQYTRWVRTAPVAAQQAA